MRYMTAWTYMALYSTGPQRRAEVGSCVYEVKSSRLASVATKSRLVCNFSRGSPTRPWQERSSRTHSNTQCFKCSRSEALSTRQWGLSRSEGYLGKPSLTCHSSFFSSWKNRPERKKMRWEKYPFCVPDYESPKGCLPQIRSGKHGLFPSALYGLQTPSYMHSCTGCILTGADWDVVVYFIQSIIAIKYNIILYNIQNRKTEKV